MSIHTSAAASPPSPSQYLPHAVIERAGLWWARAQADNASAEDHAACSAWRDEHPDHEQAWQAMLALDRQLTLLPRAMPAAMAHDVLTSAAGARRKRQQSRRQLLGLAVAIPTATTLLYLGGERQVWHSAFADHRTQTGEIRSITLEDGTQIVLASASAFDVHYSSHERRIILHSGQIMVTSAKDPHSPARPLVVQTPQGNATAIGTRFTVAVAESSTCLQVFEGAVMAAPAGKSTGVQLIEAGQATRFTESAVYATTPVAAGADGWTKGLLSVSDMRLADVLQELAHYRSGIVRCDPVIASLRVTGVFPLHATDRALHNLTLGLPIRVQYRTRYWVSVLPL